MKYNQDHYYGPESDPYLRSRGGSHPFIEPDLVANEADDQLPTLSSIGLGPIGPGVYVTVTSNEPGCFSFALVSDETDEAVMQSPNLASGIITISQPEHDMVPGEVCQMLVHVTRCAGDVQNYSVQLPPGADGSRIFTVKEYLARTASEVYDLPIDQVYYDNKTNWESKPLPRPNDIVIFSSMEEGGQYTAINPNTGEEYVVPYGTYYLSVGNVEAVENGRVIFHARTHINTMVPHIGENGNWYFDELDTGVRAVGIDGVSPILAGFEPSTIFVDPGDGTIPDNPNHVNIRSYTWDGLSIQCNHELYLKHNDGSLSDVIAAEMDTSNWDLDLHAILDGYDLREYSGLRCRSTESNPFEDNPPRVTFNTCAFNVNPFDGIGDRSARIIPVNSASVNCDPDGVIKNDTLQFRMIANTDANVLETLTIGNRLCWIKTLSGQEVTVPTSLSGSDLVVSKKTLQTQIQESMETGNTPLTLVIQGKDRDDEGNFNRIALGHFPIIFDQEIPEVEIPDFYYWSQRASNIKVYSDGSLESDVIWGYLRRYPDPLTQISISTVYLSAHKNEGGETVDLGQVPVSNGTFTRTLTEEEIESLIDYDYVQIYASIPPAVVADTYIPIIKVPDPIITEEEMNTLLDEVFGEEE